MDGRLMTSPDIQPRAYRVLDFCRAYGLSRATAYKLMAEGKLESVRVAGRRLIPADAAEALLRDGSEPFYPDRDRPAFVRFLLDLGCQPPPETI